MQPGLGTILVSQHYRLPVTLDAHRANAERSAHGRVEGVVRLCPVELAIKALVTRLYRDSTDELPIADVAQHRIAGLPGAHIGQLNSLACDGTSGKQANAQHEPDTWPRHRLTACQ